MDRDLAQRKSTGQDKSGLWLLPLPSFRRLLATFGKPVAEEDQIGGIFLAVRACLHAPEQTRRRERNRDTVHLVHGHVTRGLFVLDAAC